MAVSEPMARAIWVSRGGVSSQGERSSGVRSGEGPPAAVYKRVSAMAGTTRSSLAGARPYSVQLRRPTMKLVSERNTWRAWQGELGPDGPP